ncbi:MAG: hypothetical protein JWM16_5800 [Verrucomicrobiales bacterium]|nr:hypothetical protein [Verrucomicrobiales bacterium]
MNIPPEKIEHLLRKAPSPTPPAGLYQDLKAEIILPRTMPSQSNGFNQPSFFRRWMPVLSLSLWLMACLVLLGVQIRRVTELKEENTRLLAAANEKSTVTPQVAVSGDAELDRLRADSLEASQLRAEVARLREELAKLEGLRMENQRLASELQSSGKAGISGQPQDFIAAAAEKGERIKCIGNLKQVGLGARMYANDHGDIMPKDFASLRNELPNDSETFCPSSNGSVRFEILAPGEKEGDPNVVFARCPTHNNVLLMDGSAQQLGDKFKVIIRADGKPIVGRGN